MEAARAWHGQKEFGDGATTGTRGGRRLWAEALGGARWVLGWAGGDDEGEGDGRSYLLVANVLAGGRGFLTASGWGWGRALDAQEADYVRVEDTVLPHEDYRALDSVYQPGFSRLDTLFYRASYRSLEEAAEAKKSALASSRPAVLVSSPQIVRPAARPYAHD